MEKLTLTVTDKVGLHARPATLFVGVATQFQSEVRVRNGTTGSDWADAKSILSVLVLGVERHHTIELECEGPDEAQAARALGKLVMSDFTLTPNGPEADEI